MLLTGIQKLSLLDYPGTISCILFTGGCTMRCGYCHNPEFVDPKQLAQLQPALLKEEAVLSFLSSRRGLLEGVTVCGGEPTVHTDLPEFIRKIRQLGFKIKLDTNGSNPGMLHSLLAQGLLDYVAMDVKHTPEGYMHMCAYTAVEKITESIACLRESVLEYEFRTTVIPTLHTPEVMHHVGVSLTGAKKWVLQAFRNTHTLDSGFAQYLNCTETLLEEYKKIAERYVEQVEIRT